MRKIYLIIYTIFSGVILLLTLATLTGAMLPQATLAQNSGGVWENPDLQVKIPTLEWTAVSGIGTQTVTVYWIANYLGAIYKLGIGAAGILATVMIMIGGLLWLTAAGKSGQIDQGKTMIYGAITGLFIAMFSYIILLTINPSLVNMRGLQIPVIDKTLPTQWCDQLIKPPYNKDVTLTPDKGTCGQISTITENEGLPVKLNLPSKQCTWSGCNDIWAGCNVKTKQCTSCAEMIDNTLAEMGLDEGPAGCDFFSPKIKRTGLYDQCMFTHDWDAKNADDSCVQVHIYCNYTDPKTKNLIKLEKCQDYDNITVNTPTGGKTLWKIEDVHSTICAQNPCQISTGCKVNIIDPTAFLLPAIIGSQNSYCVPMK